MHTCGVPTEIKICSNGDVTTVIEVEKSIFKVAAIVTIFDARTSTKLNLSNDPTLYTQLQLDVIYGSGNYGACGLAVQVLSFRQFICVNNDLSLGYTIAF